MEVKLAGHNVDKEGLKKIEKGISKKDWNLVEEGINETSPESVPASYARISRDSAKIPELRKKSREDLKRARKTNESIIFWYGHTSIAEHANFNFDIMGVSRALVEEIEKHRIGIGYTEKSQRYITLDGDFVIPQEIKGTKYEKSFVGLIEKQNKFYKDTLEPITNWHFKNIDENFLKSMGITDDKKRTSTLKGWGKEDTRYALSMATQAQIGMTTSARSLEYMIKCLRSGKTKEEIELGEKLLNEVEGIAPSLIKYTEPTNYLTKTRNEIRAFVSELIDSKNINMSIIKLNSKIPHDKAILSGLIFSHSNLSLEESYELFNQISDKEKRKFIELTIKYQKVHDPALREFELREPYEFNKMSASAFAQMKRHRMNTIITQDYDPSLENTIPESINGSGLKEKFKDLIEKTNELYGELKKNQETKNVAHYILTNSHRRRVLLDANPRQILAIAKERKNLYAQWDIRDLINEYVEYMKDYNPLIFEFSPGKHEFDYRKKEFFDGK